MLAEVRDRLADTDAFRHAGLAGALAELGGALKQSPSVFVLPGAERAGEVRTSPMRQLITREAAVLIGLLDTGERGLDAFEDLRVTVLAAMLGFRPAGSARACAYAGGRLALFDARNRAMFFEMRFAAQFHIQETHP